jgi:sigma-B regulation protein RsbU (phosphoserine phosphatase)
MLTAVFSTLLHEYRAHRMARFSAWVLVFGTALGMASLLSRGTPRGWWFLFWLSLLVSGIYYLARLVSFVRNRLLWRLRSRLIVTYLFIAVVPIILIILLVVIGAFIINGQFAAFLVTQRLKNHADELRQLNRAVVHEVHLAPPPSPETLLDNLRAFYVAELSSHSQSYPDLEITLRVGALERAFRLDGTVLPEPVTVPTWFKQQEFSGIVVDRGRIDLRAIARTRVRDGDVVVILSQPLTPQLLDLVGKGIGPVGIFVPHGGGGEGAPPAGGSPARSQKNSTAPEVAVATVSSDSVPLPPRAYLLDYKVYGASTLEPEVWDSPQAERLGEPVFIYASSRIVTLNRQLITTLGEYSRIYVLSFEVLAGVFFVLEVLALIVGVRLTRSVTSAADHLYDATERVKAGDFSYRIGVPARDQLSALSAAFDNMTASIERLLRESQEKLKLESELEIAREVQNQLFPREVPEVEGVELYGVCKPASGVSGDYYDFLQLGEDRVGLVLGDVSGKGISAALLMAAIQSALHAQFYDGRVEEAPGAGEAISTADVVDRLNRQLQESTSLEKYATFFYAVYDAKTHVLTYTNAGHLAPALLRRGSIERLKVGGTVVGLFAPMEYQQAEILLEPGDLLLAFTDGLTEPENTYGEEFGEKRLLEALQRAAGGKPEEIVDEIYRSVSDWTGSPELQDDMTLILIRRSA